MVDDERYMAMALRLAERGRGRTSPNPMVGAIVVSPGGVIVGRGHHEAAGQPHAEVKALEAAGEATRGATLYCTLEPCCHWGRTGPCVQRIVEAGVVRVVAAMEDPDARVRGGGFEYLRAHGVDVMVGPGQAEALLLNAAFVTAATRGRPYVTIKIALSLDGRVAGPGGQRVRLTGPAADRLTHLERAAVDAIGVGAGTMLADDPLLTARGAYRQRPCVRVVFDRRLRTPPSARLLSTLGAGPVIIMASPDAVTSPRARALQRVGAEIVGIDGDLTVAVAALHRMGVQSLLLEGGPTLHLAAWRARLVDQVRIWITPRMLGPDGVPWLSDRELSVGQLSSRRVECRGNDVLVEGYVHRID